MKVEFACLGWMCLVLSYIGLVLLIGVRFDDEIEIWAMKIGFGCIVRV